MSGVSWSERTNFVELSAHRIGNDFAEAVFRKEYRGFLEGMDAQKLSRSLRYYIPSSIIQSNQSNLSWVIPH